MVLAGDCKNPAFKWQISNLKKLNFFAYWVNFHDNLFVCLFDLILYVPSTIFQLNGDKSSWVEPVIS